MMNVLKKYWWIVISVILIPCLINLIMIQPRIYRIVGNDTSWLSFWGGYIGSIISSSIALYILWKQLNQNHQENDENRKLQLKNIEYQQQSQWLNLLRSKFADYYSAVRINDLTFVGDMIMNKEDQSYIRNEIKKMIDRMANANCSIKILFSKNIDSYEKRLLLEIKKITDQFYATLSDFDWYVVHVAYHLGSFESNKKMYKEKTDEYKKNAYKYILIYNRIWDIIIANDYNIFDKHEEIVSKYLNDVLKVLDFDNVLMHIANLIDYEQNKIDNIFKS